MKKEDVVVLLTSENPFFSEFLTETCESIQEMDLGGLVMVYKHIDRYVIKFYITICLKKLRCWLSH